MLREFITANLALPVVLRAGGENPELRASLLASQLIGFGLCRYVLAFETLAATPSDELTAILGTMLQHTCAGPLGSPWAPAETGSAGAPAGRPSAR